MAVAWPIVQPDLVTVLADAAENVEEIDVVRAEATPARRGRRRVLAQGVPPDLETPT